MYQYKNQNITDFFKPSARSAPQKRAREEDHVDDLPRKRSSPSPQPLPGGASDGVLPERHRVPLQRSFSSSSLTPIPSDASTIPIPSGALGPSSADEDGLDDGIAVQPPHMRYWDRRANPPKHTAKPTTADQTGAANGHEASVASFRSDSVLLSSQRVVKNGETMIKGSDDERDSDDSFEDLERLMDLRRGISNGSKGPPKPKMTLRATASNGSTVPAEPKRMFSLAALVAQAEKSKAIEADVLEARQLVERSERQRESNRVADGGKRGGHVKKGLLDAVMVDNGGSGDDKDKLLQAIDRTEAFHQRESWHFFDPLRAQNDRPAFPFGAAIPDATSLHSGILSGWMIEMAGKGKLPPEMLSWILDHGWKDQSEMWRDTYRKTLKEAGLQAAALLTPRRLDSLFAVIGAHDDALNLQSDVLPRFRAKPAGPPRDWSAVSHLLLLLADLASWLEPLSRVHSLHLLGRLALDSDLLTQGQVLLAYHQAWEALVGHMDERRYQDDLCTVMTTLFPRIHDPHFRLQAMRSIPATSAWLCLFRRRLALAFFFDNDDYLTRQPARLLRFSSIRKRLRCQAFAITRETDYSFLTAAIGLLDIGLDDGDPPLAASKEDEADFDRNVDLLSEQVDAMWRSITDHGASHMNRTEAKNALDAFLRRLKHAVRLRPAAKVSVYGESVFDPDQLAKGSQFMNRFLESKKIRSS